jgi:two-component system, sensor histidine kinase YesM
MLKILYDKIYSFYMNLSIKYKILIFFFTIIIFVSLTLGIYSYIASSNTIQEEVASVNLRDIKQTSGSINLLQKDVKDLSTFVCLNPLVQAFVKSEVPSNNIYNYNSVSLEPLNSLLASKDYISFIVIYGNNGTTYYLSSDRSTGINSYEDIKKSDIYKKAHGLKGSPIWIDLREENQIFISDNKEPKIAMVRTIINTNTLEEAGLMVICINHSTLERIYSGNQKITEGSTIMLDANNNVISFVTSDKALQKNPDFSPLLPYINSSSGYDLVTLNKIKFLITFNSIEQSSWKMVSLIPMSALLKNLNSTLTMTIIVIISCLIISLIMALFISSALTSPIKKLLASMQKVKSGSFKEKVSFKYKDEIGMLGAEYNDMIDNIKTLIDKVYKLQIKEKEAELKALQAQINPHFLYNTLDTIFWKAEKSNQKDISDMVYALSRLFRITLSRGNEFIFLRSEKEFIEHYLLLQSKRFKHKLSYKINISDSILDYTIPKLIIQPFVENSITHATEGDNDMSFIEISGRLCSDKLVFIVEDNGCGMSEETINLLLSNKLSEDKNLQGSYAIRNVNQRLALYYNNNYVLNISSKLGQGTKVEIEIPLYPNEAS